MSKNFAYLAVVTILVVFVAWVGYQFPVMAWDTWAYHLPFSTMYFGVDDGKIIYDASVVARYNGFPLFAEIAQGFAWRLTGNVYDIVLPNTILYAASVALTCYVSPRIGLHFSLLCVSAPLVFLNITSGYVDYTFSALLYIGYISLVLIAKQGKQIKNSQFIAYCILFQSAFIIGGNVKLFAPLVVFAIIITFGMVFNKRLRFGCVKNAVFYFSIIIAIIGSSYQLIKNTVNHGNPVYPVAVEIRPFNVLLQGPEIEYKNSPGYIDIVGAFAKPIYFLLSVTEVDWVIRGVKPSYNVDSNTGDNNKRFSSARTGGFFGPLSFILLIVVCLGILKTTSNPNEGVKFVRSLLVHFILFTFVITFLPQSHELRYCIYWWLILAFVASSAIDFVRSQFYTIFTITIFVFCATSIYMTLENSLIEYYHHQERIPRELIATPDIKNLNDNVVCLGSKFTPNQIIYSRIFTENAPMVIQNFGECNVK